MVNAVVWIDIPVVDLDRASQFYSAVLGQSLLKHEFPGMTIGVLPHGEHEVGGCLFCDPERRPTDRSST